MGDVAGWPDIVTASVSLAALGVSTVALSHSLSARAVPALDVAGRASMSGEDTGHVLTIFNVGRMPLCVVRVGVPDASGNFLYQHRDEIAFDGEVVATPELPLVIQPGEFAAFPYDAFFLGDVAIDGRVRYRVTYMHGAVKPNRPRHRDAYAERDWNGQASGWRAQS